MAVAVVVGAGLYLLGGPRLAGLFRLKMPGLQPPPPPYEQPLGLPGQVARIDRAIFGALFRLGLSTEDVHFERVERLRTAAGGCYEQARVRVELPPAVSVKAARAELSRSLAGLGGRLSASWRSEAGRTRGELFWDGLLTHSLELCRRPEALARPSAPLGELPQVALVMDDLGYDLGQTRRLIGLKLPVTASVLPHSPHGRESLELASEAGLECLAHLPMEAEGLPAKRLGEGALLMDMDAGELLRTLREDLDALPGVDGANNHMGSALTASEPRMRVILGELKRRGLVFLDSRTSSGTLGFSLAGELGLKAAERDIFLDTVQDKEAVLAQLARLASVARSQGRAVAICHPYPATFEALKEGLPALRRQVRLVRLSELVRAAASSAPRERQAPVPAPGGGPGPAAVGGGAPAVTAAP